MSNWLVYRNHFGAAAVYSVPTDEAQVPQSASIPQGPFPRANAEVAAKGHAITWAEWAQHLTGHAPYFETWTVEDVPGEPTPHGALSFVRERDAQDIWDTSTGKTEAVKN